MAVGQANCLTDGNCFIEGDKSLKYLFVEVGGEHHYPVTVIFFVQSKLGVTTESLFSSLLLLMLGLESVDDSTTFDFIL